MPDMGQPCKQTFLKRVVQTNYVNYYVKSYLTSQSLRLICKKEKKNNRNYFIATMIITV